MTKPLVSIITPSYNRADIIPETAESVFKQTYPHWEWIVVDDGSTDNTLQILESFAARDKRVKIFQRNRDPKGGNVCRNIGIEQSKGDYLIFLDSDDLLATFCLEQRVTAIEENQDADLIIFPMLFFKSKPGDYNFLWNVETGEDDVLRFLHADPICQTTGPIWKKSSLVNIGMWREDLLQWQDLELDLRAWLKGLKYVKKLDLLPDAFTRETQGSVSRAGYHSPERLASRMAIFEYAVNELIAQGREKKYINGLKYMGYTLLDSGIQKQNFAIGKRLIEIMDKNAFFSAFECRLINLYYKIHVNRGKFSITPSDRINYFIFRQARNAIFNKLKKYIPAPQKMIQKVTWDKEVLL